MRRALVSTLLLLTLGSASSAVAAEGDRKMTPVWLPRGIFLGGVLGDASSPTFRVSWMPVLWQDRTGALLFIGEGGLAYAARPVLRVGPTETATMTFFYQHVVTFGLGFRSSLGQGLHWGFQITSGPLWHGARFDTLRKENRVQGIVEGRVLAGLKLGPVEYGVSAGYSSPYKLYDRGNSTPHVGGWMVGLYADWL